MHAGTRSRLAALGAAALAAVMTGCAPFAGEACPAIGWTNVVEIRLDGPADDVERVAWVELCDDRGCSTPATPPAPPLEAPPPPPPLSPTSLPRSPASSPPPGPPSYQAGPDGRGSWTVQVDMSTPDTVTVRAFAADSTVLGGATVDLAWKRIGGSEACGGPMDTEPINLAVGS